MAEQHPPDDREHLVALLDAARTYTGTVLDAVRDPAQIVHADTGWTVADVAGHILVWEQEFERSLAALQHAGTPHTIAGFTSFEDYNRHQRDRLREVSLARLRGDLAAVRKRIKAALWALPPEQFVATVTFPWPAEGTLATLVLIMAAHERAHAREIAAAVGAGDHGDPP